MICAEGKINPMTTTDKDLTRLSRRDCKNLADSFADTPSNVQTIHALKHGTCHAFLSGTLSQRDALLVQPFSAPQEPMGFGPSVSALLNLLLRVPGWSCVWLNSEIAGQVGAAISAAIGHNVDYLDDIALTLTKPVPEFHHPDVRMLTLKDRALLESSPEELRTSLYPSAKELLTNGYIAGAIVNSHLVATALTVARTQKYAEIGVTTLTPYRGKGLASTAASLVASSIARSNQTPVWSVGEHNAASLRIAHKLGFEGVAKHRYVILTEKTIWKENEILEK